MSSVDVERQVAEYFGWLDEQLGPIERPADHGTLTALDATGWRRPRGWWVAAAAATVLALVGGLVLIAGREADRGQAPAADPRGAPMLADVDDLGPDEWVYPTVLPDDVAFAHAFRQDRMLRFAAPGEASVYTVLVDQPTVEPAQVDTDGSDRTTELLAGHPWEIVTNDDVWIATRHLGSWSVMVIGPIGFDDTARAVIDGLAVVGETDLPSSPVGLDDLTVVARYRSDEGLTATLAVTESNGAYCARVFDETGSGGAGSSSCGILDPRETIVTTLTSSGPSPGGERLRIDAAGIVSSEVAHVEVELADGAVVAVDPTDLSGEFDVGFWVIATEIDTDLDRRDASRAPTSVSLGVVRAYDATGNLLATHGLGPIHATDPTPPAEPDNAEPDNAEPDIADQVPMLLPAHAVPGATSVVRFEGAAGEAGSSSYVQTFYDADRAAYLVITTSDDQGPTAPDELRTPVDTSGWETAWDAAFFVATDDEFANLQLAADGGLVRLHALRLSDDEVLEIARSIRRRTLPLSGWDTPLLPVGLRAFAESGDVPTASRSLVWSTVDRTVVAELVVAAGHAEVLTAGWSRDADVGTIDLDGSPAIVASDGGRVTISWSISDEVQALFGYLGDRDTAVEIVRSLRPVDIAEWVAASQLPDPRADGCHSMFC